MKTLEPCETKDPMSLRHEGESTHLVVFVHGLTASVTASDARHGQALRVALAAVPQAAKIHLHFASSIAGSRGFGTFFSTLSGIERGGALVAEEVLEVVKTLPALDRISLVGASLGGMFCRHAAYLLFGASGRAPMLPAAIRPHAFITLATPHLGVRYLFASTRTLRFGASLTASASELNLSDAVGYHALLIRMAHAPHTESLERFRVRIAIAPLLDDGVVAYSTAAMTGRPTGDATAPPGVLQYIVAERHVSAATSRSDPIAAHLASKSTEEWTGEGGSSYFAGRSKARLLTEALHGLLACGWRVVDVRMAHKHLATLYPNSEGAEEVATYVAGCLAVGARE